LEHIPDPRLFLRAAAKQLKPGGHLLVSVPGARFVSLKTWPHRRAGIRNLGVPLVFDAGNHLHYFSIAGLRRAMNDVGLSVSASGPVPPDYNYLANRHSAGLKRIWGVIAGIGEFTGGEPLSSNIWILCSRPVLN
jgi:SAM-dependent methyltransferase